MNYAIDLGKRITGDCKVSAPKRKDGKLFLRLTVTSFIEDDDIGGSQLAMPLRPVQDQLIKVRKGASDNTVTGYDTTATLNARVGKVFVWGFDDGHLGEPIGAKDADGKPKGVDGALVKVRATAGKRHTKQVAVVDVWGGAAELGPFIECAGIDVALRVKRVPQAGELPLGEDATDDEDEDLPEEAGQQEDLVEQVAAAKGKRKRAPKEGDGPVLDEEGVLLGTGADA